MSRLWNWCAFCGKRIETGEMCYGLPSGESVCTDCCVAENEGAAVSDGEEEVESLLGACAVKTGRWLLTDAYPHRMYCSECFSTAVPNVEILKQWGMEYEFCPHCGAPMKGVQDVE